MPVVTREFPDSIISQAQAAGRGDRVERQANIDVQQRQINLAEDESVFNRNLQARQLELQQQQQAIGLANDLRNAGRANRLDFLNQLNKDLDRDQAERHFQQSLIDAQEKQAFDQELDLMDALTDASKEEREAALNQYKIDSEKQLAASRQAVAEKNAAATRFLEERAQAARQSKQDRIAQGPFIESLVGEMARREPDNPRWRALQNVLRRYPESAHGVSMKDMEGFVKSGGAPIVSEAGLARSLTEEVVVDQKTKVRDIQRLLDQAEDAVRQATKQDDRVRATTTEAQKRLMAARVQIEQSELDRLSTMENMINTTKTRLPPSIGIVRRAEDYAELQIIDEISDQVQQSIQKKADRLIALYLAEGHQKQTDPLRQQQLLNEIDGLLQQHDAMVEERIAERQDKNFEDWDGDIQRRSAALIWKWNYLKPTPPPVK